jgi:hypothetical protein
MSPTPAAQAINRCRGARRRYATSHDGADLEVTSRLPCLVIRPRCTVVSDSWCFGVNPAHEANGSVALAEGGLEQAGLMPRRPVAVPASWSSIAEFRFLREVIMLAVRWYLRYGLSYRDVEELLAERGIVVDHVTIYRWVQRFTPELIDAARPSRHVAGDRWFIDETYLRVAEQWVYLYRAIDQHGQVIDVLASPKRGSGGDPPVLRQGTDRGATADRGDHRPGTGLPPGARRGRARGLPRDGAVRQQPDRSRSRQIEGPDPPDARPETAPLRPDGL